MIALAIGVGLAISALVGRWICRRSDRAARTLAVVVCGSLTVALTSVIVAGLSAPFSPWDTVRLAPSMTLLRGINPYAGEHAGVVLSTMYGPVAIVAFVPAALFNDMALGTITGRWLAFLFAFGPLLACTRVRERSPDRSWRFAILALATLAMLLSPALRYSTTFLHADAPALGLTGLACWMASSRREYGLATALVCVLAMWTKQTMLPLPVAIFFSIGMFRGRKAAVRFGLQGIVLGAVSLGILLLLVDRDSLYLNMVQIPGGVPWRGRAPWNLSATTGELLVHGLPFLAGWIATFSRGHEPSDETRSIPFFLAAVLLAPMAILGRVKDAGDINSFSPCLYPLLLAVVCRLVEIKPSFVLSRSVSTIVAALTLMASTRLHEDIRLLTIERPFHAEADYLAAHPHAVYFPWNPSAHLAAEGRPMHHLFSAWERGVAGFPVDGERVRSSLPPQCLYVAFPLKRLGPTVGFGSCVQMLERSGLLAPDAAPVRLVGLPDYECYALTR